MAKINAKNLAIAIFFGVFLVGIIGIVNAQEAIPTGGDSFETAVKIESGSYEGVGLEYGKPEYFYINVKPGQDLKIEGTFKAFPKEWGEETIGLYDENRKKLVEVGESMDKGQQVLFSFSWLPNADKDSYKYYIKRECTWHKIELLSLNISLTNRYDAGSQTDAGDTFEKAISITPGEYEAYLSGKEGADAKDFYKISIKKGETLTTKVTPPGEAAMQVIVYGSNRAELKSEAAPNPGAIVEASLTAEKSESVFIAVLCDKYCSESVVNYTLNISIQPPAGAREPVGEEEEGEEEIILPLGEEGVPTGEGTEGEIEKEAAEEATKAIGKGIATVVILWIVGPIVFLIIVGIVVYFLLKKKKK